MLERKIYLEKISPFMQKPLVKVISGLRRSGKSTFMKILIENLKKKGVLQSNIIFISMELMEFEHLSDYKILYNYVKKKISRNKDIKYLFIDEVQEISGWEKAVNSIFAENLADIYLTGSNSRLFSSEFASLLTGRYIEIEMFPLGFAEFLQFRGKEISDDCEKEFEFYLKYGGLPGIHYLQFEDEVVFQYINSIFNTILLKDIVSRFNIREVFLLEKITAYIFDNCGSISSSKKIADYLKSQHIKTGIETVMNYIHYLQDAYLVYKSGRFDLKGKKHLELYEKYYSSDIGIRHSVLGYKKNDISGILENVVYLELLRRGYTVCTGKCGTLEVDFIAEKNGKIIYIQVAYLLASKETEDREFKPLEKINDNYPKVVLSMDKLWGNNRNGILRMSIIDFLLSQECSSTFSAGIFQPD
ncbi:MAG: ATP-binding protein [Candidatus Riflebacteria bacterium]|nr:ATP-binding protein [Candidatus Riflebacteria bacterium]